MNLDDVKKIALIDADSLIYYCSLGNKDVAPSLENAIVDIDSRINNMVENGGCSHYVLFLSKKYNNFRHNLVPSYKSNRPKTKLPPVFIGLKAYMEQKPSVICRDFEADDGVGIFRNLIQQYYNKECIICSPDKDVLNQLEGTHFNYGKSEIISTSNEESYKFLFKQLLMGDNSDGIKGIPKVGDKTSDKILESFIIDKTPFPQGVLNKYTEYFGLVDGIRKFSDTFRQVYLLRSNEDLERECGYQISEIEMDEILLGSSEETGNLLELKLSW